MTPQDICYLDATELLEHFKKRQLSPVEVLKAYIEQDGKIGTMVNPFSHRFYDEALIKARLAEQKYFHGKQTRKIEGLPIAIKDETLVKGMPCSSGSLINKDYIADVTSIENSRILRAGGIIHARTTTPEFSCAGYTHSRLHGVTRNPWNPAFTPGGSSGGAAAALASGLTALATGSDIGGSIRIPASACGVVGFKPPYGRNASEPPFNLDTYCHTGPLARSIDDAILLQNVVSGPHPEDIASIKPKLTLPFDYPDIKGKKVAYSIDLGQFEVDEEVKQNTLQAVELLRSQGAIVEEVEINWPTDLVAAGLDYLNHFFGVYIGEYIENHRDLMTDYALAFGEAGKQSNANKFFHAQEVAGEMYRQFGPLFKRYDLFICPTNALAAVAAEHDQSRDLVTINGKQVDPILGWVMTLPFNMLSRCPVLSIPSGRTRDNVPTGVQLVGATFQDKSVFQFGKALESARGRWYQDPAQRPDMTSVN